MSPLLPVIPDAEMLVGDWLRTHPDIGALDARVAGKTPSSMGKPWIRVTQLGVPRAHREHLLTFALQLDCYAGKDATDLHTGQAQASLLARTARAVLMAQAGVTRDGVVISHVRVTGHPRVPDTTLEPARERMILTVEITLHGVSA